MLKRYYPFVKNRIKTEGIEQKLINFTWSVQSGPEKKLH